MIVTHKDSDHSGGAASVLENFDVAAVLSSLPSGDPLLGLAPGAQPCIAGQNWDWDGVRFEMLHPASAMAKARKTNDLSCVLKVSAGSRSMLLTGDIEKPAELELVERAARVLTADVLLAPHHGSRTSSSVEFLAAVGPSNVVVPAGYRNRFGHPNADVLGRYSSTNARILRTDLDGAITVGLSGEGLAITGERQRHRRYWHDAPS
jgi:competence protein ComEC